ncbi:Exopolysaccharide production protein ExoQ [Chitinispirillum alkaliphilum]|nr:Exopolysaccharide production protein ExoQ [Chitinispirillum alkaliphilum]
MNSLKNNSEEKRESKVSLIMWLPLLWLLRVGSRSLAYWFDPELATVEDGLDYLHGNIFDRTFFLTLMAMGGAVLVYRRFALFEFVRNNKLLVLLYIYMAVTILWSAFPEVAMRRWVRSVGDLMMVLVVFTETDYVKSIHWMLRRFAYILVPLSVIFVKYYRHLGVAYDYSGRFTMWIGVTTHKNSLAQLVALSSLFFVWAYFRKKGSLFDIPVLIMSLWLLGGSPSADSATSILAFLSGSVMTFAFLRMRHVKHLAYYVAIFFSAVLLTEVMLNSFFGTSIFSVIVESRGRDETLTGRTDLWVEVIREGMLRPWGGAGYGTFWMGDLTHNLWEIFPWRPMNAHNGFLDIFLELGFIGLGLVVALIVVTIKGVLRLMARGSEFAKFRFIWLVLIIVYNISESSYTRPTALLWFIFLLFAVNDPNPSGEELREETTYNEDFDFDSKVVQYTEGVEG